MATTNCRSAPISVVNVAILETNFSPGMCFAAVPLMKPANRFTCTANRETYVVKSKTIYQFNTILTWYGSWCTLISSHSSYSRSLFKFKSTSPLADFSNKCSIWLRLSWNLLVNAVTIIFFLTSEYWWDVLRVDWHQHVTIVFVDVVELAHQ